MKTKIINILFLVFLCIYPAHSRADSGYQELNTPYGKAFTGITREEALQKFGVPDQADKDTWAYLGKDNFFIFFKKEPFLSVYLYPLRCTTDIGAPLEFKIFGYSSDMVMKDITREADLLIDEPENFIVEGPGLIIPRRAGEYEILAKYKGVFSNPAYLTIKESQTEIKTDRLVSINILPYKPAVLTGNKVDFMALGVFINPSGTYSLKNISKQVNWRIKQGTQVTDTRNNIMYFPFPGTQEVSCGYQDLESLPQEVYVSDKPPVSREKLKHITVLPEVMPAALGKNINISALGTYYNNRVEDITRKVRWEVADRNVAALQDNGSFLAKSVGLTDVTAESEGLRSPAAKIIVTDKRTGKSFILPEKKKARPEDLDRDIKNEIQKLKKELSGEEKKLTSVKINPVALNIPAGETGQFTAVGAYSDGSQEDLTNLADWSSSNDKIASALNGKINTFLAGEASVYAKFKDVKSLPALVRVEGPKLVSIIITPQNIQTTMEARPELKAEGYYSDSSRKDITSTVNWEFTIPRVIKIEKGRVYPLRFGQTAVYAEYAGIKSLPANVSVIFTMAWLSGIIIKTAVFLILVLVLIFIFLYILTEKEKNRLREHFNKNPAEFMVILYGNLKRILGIFNLIYKENVPPLSYAELIQKKLSVEDNSLLRFTVKFEEARYSHHALTSGDATAALSDYNNFLKALFSRFGKASFFLKYCRSLWLRTPLFITTN